MELNASKISVLQKILSLNQEHLIQKIEEILDQEMIIAYSTNGEGLTKAQYNLRLENAENEIAKGAFVTQEHLEKESDTW
jgi:recombinational DNA repair protein RecR